MPREVTQKKKGSLLGLQRRVKTRKQPEPEPEYLSEDEAPSEGGVANEGDSDEEENDGSDAESEVSRTSLKIHCQTLTRAVCR